MIQLHPDFLFFETSQGQIIPCSAELVAVELIGEAIGSLDPEVVREAAAAVLHFFKEDLGLTTVSVGEFSRALSEALSTLGIRVSSADGEDRGVTLSCDLRRLVQETGRGLELSFYPKLREELRLKLGRGPKTVRFHGLRDCVKELAGVKRWNGRCERLSDQIVDFLRACLAVESGTISCDLIVC